MSFDIFKEFESYAKELEQKHVQTLCSFEDIRKYVEGFSFSEKHSEEEIFDWVIHGMKEYQLHTSHPNYFGVFNPKPVYAGVVGDALASLFNPQLASTTSSPFAILLEEKLIQTFAEVFGFSQVEGAFTSGGSEANFTALQCALAVKAPNYHTQGLSSKGCVYVSSETHQSVARAVRLSGLGQESLVEVGIKKDLSFDTAQLKEKIQQDKSEGKSAVMLVATFGSTSSGTIDPLEDLIEIAKSERVWLHLDAAWGAAALFLPEFESYQKLFREADSMTFDPHKWLSVPMGAGLFLTKHLGSMKHAFGNEKSPYMPNDKAERKTLEPYQNSFQWSRRFMGLKVFMALASLGKSGYQEMLRHQIEMGRYMKERLAQEDWKVVNPGPLPVACFMDAKNESAEHNQKIHDEVIRRNQVWITPTQILPFYPKLLRAGIPNYATEKKHIDVLIHELGEARFKIY